MRKVIAIAAAIVFISGSIKAAAQSNNAFKMPWYSTNFEMGDPKYAQVVLKLYQDYTNNTFVDDEVFADTLSIDFSTGRHVKGKDSVNNLVKRFRGNLASSTIALATYTVIKAKDRNETWVCVWGKETDESKDGKKDAWYFNENWMFNKEGKIAYISQYEAASK